MIRPARAFVVAPIVATVVHALMLTYLIVSGHPANPGRLNDIQFLTIDVGNFIFIAIVGLPFAAVAAILAVPLYLLFRATIGVSFASAIANGVMVGVAVTAMFAGHSEGFVTMPLIRTVPTGVVSAAVWWRVATWPQRPDHLAV